MDHRSTDLYESAQKALSAGSYQRAIDLARHSLKLSRTEKEQTRSINLLSHVYYYVKAPRACINLIEGYSGSISSELFNVLEQRKKTCVELLRFIDEANNLVGVIGSMPYIFIDIAEDLNIAVVGDSHVSSFSQALFSCRVVQTSPPLRGSDSRLAQALADLDNYNYILLSICGNMHTILSLSPDFRDPSNRNRSYLKSEIIDYFVRAICFAIYPILDYIKLRTSANKVT